MAASDAEEIAHLRYLLAKKERELGDSRRSSDARDERLVAAYEAIAWIADRAHQAHHVEVIGGWDQCSSAVCREARRALGKPEPISTDCKQEVNT